MRVTAGRAVAVWESTKHLFGVHAFNLRMSRRQDRRLLLLADQLDNAGLGATAGHLRDAVAEMRTS